MGAGLSRKAVTLFSANARDARRGVYSWALILEIKSHRSTRWTSVSLYCFLLAHLQTGLFSSHAIGFHSQPHCYTSSSQCSSNLLFLASRAGHLQFSVEKKQIQVSMQLLSSCDPSSTPPLNDHIISPSVIQNKFHFHFHCEIFLLGFL